MINIKPLATLVAAMLSASAVTAVFAQPGVAQAAAQENNSPTAPVATLYSALATVEKQNNPATFAQRANQLMAAVDGAFDISTVLQNSVGLRYRSLPDAQKQQLLQVFRQFTIARYVSNFAPGTGDTLKVLPNIRPSAYGSDEIVQTELTSASGSVTKVDYVMRRLPQGWRAIDVLLDGHISQVAVQRSDFGSAVIAGDATPLIDQLKKKIRSFSES